MGGGAPHIADEGRDGYPFAHIDTISDPGAWRDVLPFCVNVRILPDMDAKQRLDPVEGCGDTDVPVPVPGSLSTHSTDLNGRHR